MSDPILGRYPIHIETPVAWGDMDAFQHVNNTVFLRWFESARIAYFTAVGITDRRASGGVAPILARATCDYRAPVQFPDTVTIEATVVKLGNTSFTMGYRVKSHQHSGALAGEGEAVVVLFDYRSQTKVHLPEELRERILALEEAGPTAP